MARPEDLQPFHPMPQLWPLAAYDPDESFRTITPDEHRASLMAQPTRVLVGQHVQYRHELWGDVTDALVLDIAYDSPPQGYIGELLVDLPPWPTLTLSTLYGLVRTREARTRGSAGWLPLGWHEPTRPRKGRKR